MNLLFDLNATQPNVSGKRHGGGKYGEIILRRMIERGIMFSCFYDSRKWLNPEIERLCMSAGIRLFDIKDDTIRNIVIKNNIERIYSALPGELAKIDYCEVYGTIHGLRLFETPFDKYFYKYRHTFTELVKFSLKKILSDTFIKIKKKQFSDTFINSNFQLITVSNHSKYALYSYFPELKGKTIPVFYSPNTSRKEKIEIRTNEKYFMLVSGNRWEKNNLRAIIAFDRLVTEGLINNDFRMKVTGAAESCFKYKICNHEAFDFLGYVDDDELERLYAGAYALVYPSLNEGFGYPPLEAMRYNIPVIASPFSSIPEVCGGSALYFNPFSIEEIMGRMLMITEPALHDGYSKKGYEQYVKIKQRQDKDLDALIDCIIS